MILKKFCCLYLRFDKWVKEYKMYHIICVGVCVDPTIDDHDLFGFGQSSY